MRYEKGRKTMKTGIKRALTLSLALLLVLMTVLTHPLGVAKVYAGEVTSIVWQVDGH